MFFFVHVMAKEMKIALLQYNFTIGDLSGNAVKIRKGYEDAVKHGADLVVSTELALFGYPPRDLLERHDLIEEQLEILAVLAYGVGDVPLIVGVAERNPDNAGKPLFNGAAVLRDGKIETIRRKSLLPAYDVFDEYRYFEPYTQVQKPVVINGKNSGF